MTRIHISAGRGVKDGGQFQWNCAPITWDELLERVRNPEKISHKMARPFKLARTTCKGDKWDTLNKKSLQSLYALHLDFDKLTQDQLRTLREELDEYRAIIYETWNSTKGAPRARALILLDREVGPEEYRRASVAMLLRLGLPERCYDERASRGPYQPMFFSSSSRPRRGVWSFDGDPAPVEELLAEVPPPKSGSARDLVEWTGEQQHVGDDYLRSALRGIRQELEDMADQDVEWHPEFVRVAKRLDGLAAAGWNTFDEERAGRFFMKHAPEDDGFDSDRKQKLWDSVEGTCEGDDPPKQLRGIAELAAEEGVPQVEELPENLNDAMLADWVAEHLAGKMFWCPGLGWHHWTGRRWAPVRDAVATEMVRKLLIGLVLAASVKFAGNDSELERYWTTLEANRIFSQTLLARGTLLRPASELNTHPKLLNVANGVVDLETGKLLPHDPSLFLTKISATPYVPGAWHSDWESVLKILDPDVMDWMQIKIGQGATGLPAPDDVLPIGSGDGENGKSSLVAGLFAALGEHAVKVPDKLLIASVDSHPTELTTLFGVRTAIVDETPEGAHLNVPRLKAVLGQTHMTARKIAKDNFTWKTSHSLLLFTNHTPVISQSDRGTWRRMALVKFDKTFSLHPTGGQLQADQGLRDRVRDDPEVHQAALSWIVEGARRWFADRTIDLPKRVRHDTDLWREETDTVLRYVQDRLVFDPDGVVTAKDLLADVNAWLVSEGQQRVQMRIWNSRFATHQLLRDVVSKSRPLHRPAQISRPEFAIESVPSRPSLWLGIRFVNEVVDVASGEELL